MIIVEGYVRFADAGDFPRESLPLIPAVGVGGHVESGSVAVDGNRVVDHPEGMAGLLFQYGAQGAVAGEAGGGISRGIKRTPALTRFLLPKEKK